MPTAIGAMDAKRAIPQDVAVKLTAMEMVLCAVCVRLHVPEELLVQTKTVL